MSEDIVSIVSDNMKAIMEVKGITISDVTKSVGGARSVQNMLNKTTNNGCTLKTLGAIAEALGVDVVDLF